MKKSRRIAILLAAIFAGNAEVASASDQYFVVVPMKGARVASTVSLSLASLTLLDAQVGVPYESVNFKTLLTVTGDANYTGYGVKWSLVNGELPAGMALSADGVLSGTPTAAGTTTLKVRASYKTKSGENAYQLAVIGFVVSLGGATPPEATVGLAYSFDLKSRLNVTGANAFTGSDVTWAVVSSSLPAGLALKTDGTIAGTPTSAGTGSVTARATYRGVSGEQTYQVVSIALNVALATSVPPQALVGSEYSFDLNTKLSVTGDNAYNGSGVNWSVVSSTLPTGLVLQSNGTISGTPTSAGTGSVTARATYRGIHGEQTYQIVSLDIKVALATATLGQAVVGQAYSYDLTSKLVISGDNAYTGEGVTWTVVSSTLPAGLVLKANGTIGGTPTTAGTGSVTARASYRGVDGQQTYQIVSLAIKVALANATPVQAIVGQAYSYDLTLKLAVTGDSAYTGEGVKWTVVSSTLPSGLALKADGTIGGTPTTAGTGSVTARATYRGVDGEQTYQVISLSINVALATATMPPAVVGKLYSVDLTRSLSITGDNGYSGAGVTWTVVSNSLPAGLALRVDGTISGTPTAAGSGAVTVRATYRAVNGEQTYQIITTGVTVTLAAATLPEAITGQAYYFDLNSQLTVVGDNEFNRNNVSWTTDASTLPAGLFLTAGGVIVGTPTTPGSGTVSARATYLTSTGVQMYQVVSHEIIVTLRDVEIPTAAVGSYFSYPIYSAVFIANEQYAPSEVSWGLSGGALPSGLAISPDGVISGVASQAGSYSMEVQATYKGQWARRTYSMNAIQTPAIPSWSDPTTGQIVRSLSFGRVKRGSVSASTNVILRNNGGQPGYWHNIVATNGLPLTPDYSVTTANCDAVAPGGTCTVTFSFTPSKTGSISVSAWAGQGSSIALSGTGI